MLIFGPLWVILGPFWQFWVIFGPLWAILGNFWAIFGSLFGHSGRELLSPVEHPGSNLFDDSGNLEGFLVHDPGQHGIRVVEIPIEEQKVSVPVKNSDLKLNFGILETKMHFMVIIT